MRTLIDAIEDFIINCYPIQRDGRCLGQIYQLRNDSEIEIIAPESFDLNRLKVDYIDWVFGVRFKLTIIVDPSDQGNANLLVINRLLCQGSNTITVAHKPLVAKVLSLKDSQINRLYTAPESKPGLIEIENSTVESSMIDIHTVGHGVKVLNSHLKNTVLLTTARDRECTVEDSLIRSIKDQQIVLMDTIKHRRIIIDEADDPHDEDEICVLCVSDRDYLILHPWLTTASMPVTVDNHTQLYRLQHLWSGSVSILYGLSEPQSFLEEDIIDTDAFGYIQDGGNYQYFLDENNSVMFENNESIGAFELAIEATDGLLIDHPYHDIEPSLASTISHYQSHGYFM